MNLSQVQQRFYKTFGESTEKIHSFHAPGRVNLIGEHTDYNGGNVFPCALSFGTYAVARKRNDNTIHFASTNFDLHVTITTDQITYDKDHDWTNYPKGVIKYFQEEGFQIGGFEVLYDGNIPNGAGLSSSASLELATSVVLKELFNCEISMIDMVKLSQKAENNFVGVNCGIMDQFASGMGKKDYAMLLDCSTIQYEYVPVNLKGAKLVIGNTNKRRGLADSKYNERRSECETAVAELQKELDIQYLGDITPETFEKYKHLISNETVQRRAAHAVYENARTKEAVQKLNAGDIEAFGKLMNSSHESLRDLYEVTGPELDAMVEEAWKLEGTIGSRMTGAGFGGCTISIVKEDQINAFIQQVGQNYEKRTGLKPDFYIAEIGDGAKLIAE